MWTRSSLGRPGRSPRTWYAKQWPHCWGALGCCTERGSGRTRTCCFSCTRIFRLLPEVAVCVCSGSARQQARSPVAVLMWCGLVCAADDVQHLPGGSWHQGRAQRPRLRKGRIRFAQGKTHRSHEPTRLSATNVISHLEFGEGSSRLTGCPRIISEDAIHKTWLFRGAMLV
jgi:hypothetical protein